MKVELHESHLSLWLKSFHTGKRLHIVLFESRKGLIWRYRVLLRIIPNLTTWVKYCEQDSSQKSRLHISLAAQIVPRYGYLMLVLHRHKITSLHSNKCLCELISAVSHRRLHFFILPHPISILHLGSMTSAHGESTWFYRTTHLEGNRKWVLPEVIHASFVTWYNVVLFALVLVLPRLSPHLAHVKAK